MRIPWLRDRAGTMTFVGRTATRVTLASGDTRAFHLSVAEVKADSPAQLEISLRSPDGREAAHQTLQLQPGEAQAVWTDLPADTRVGELALELTSAVPGPVTARITDVRVLGQRKVLRDYITRQLEFPKRRHPRT